MKCVFCAYESDKMGEWNFCPDCGASVSAKCYKCGAGILQGAKFCVMCGASMRYRQLVFNLGENLSLRIETKDEKSADIPPEVSGPARKANKGSVSFIGDDKAFAPPVLTNKDAAAGQASEVKDERKEFKAAVSADNGKENGGALDYNSFNQSETPDFLKNINAKHAEKYKLENDQLPEAKPVRTDFLDSRSFNQSETPDFLSELIKKGKQPSFIDIKAPEDNPPAVETPAKDSPADSVVVKEDKSAADAAQENVPESVKPHSFDKFKAPVSIESILNEDDQQFSKNWGAPVIKTHVKEAEASENVHGGEEDKISASEVAFGSTHADAQKKHKPAEIKIPRFAAPPAPEPVKLATRKLLAVDSGNNRVQFVTSDSKFIGSFGTRGAGNAQFDNPQKAVIDAVGNIYVSDFSNNRIQKFTPDGQFVLSFGSHGGKNGEFNYPCGLAISKEGLLFVVDSYNNRVQVFDCEGKYISKFEGAEMSSDAQLDTPSDIAVDSANNIYVCDTGNNRVIKFDPKWRKLYELGAADKKMQGFDSPSAIAVDCDDNLVVADTGNHLVKMFDAMGGLILNFGSKGQKEGKLDSPGAVEVCDRNIYVADTWNNRIQIFSYDGAFIKSIGSYGSDPGKFNHINDIVVLDEIV
ncbi:MAG: Serine/threonine-protein kinase PknD [bacterium ADurb.Bin243]|nr:MAG: Serine/threonine-protein kinase PknD [bacterium ADurb.Bin243]HOD40145.1 6-bladed beta-propeller [Candidatus Wallbacteria bacterium]